MYWENILFSSSENKAPRHYIYADNSSWKVVDMYVLRFFFFFLIFLGVRRLEEKSNV